MTSFTAYRLLITPLSPIHIGSGESYEPTNYVIEDDILHEFDTGAAMDALTSADRKKLLEIANGKPGADMVQAVQRFFHERREVVMAHAVQLVPVLPSVASLYAKRVGQTANKEADGLKVINRLEIDRTGFNRVTRTPILFGSSIKGAMRTALLDSINNGRPARETKGLHEFQGRLFQYFDENARPRLAMEQDPMRLVQLSDAQVAGDSGMPVTQVRLAVNRKKVLVKDQHGNVRKSQAETRDLCQIFECISEWSYRSFVGQLNLQHVANIPDNDGNGKRRLPGAALRFSAAQIAKACNDFYWPVLERECKLMRERAYLEQGWDKSVQQLRSTAMDRMGRGEVFLLRVGRHSGAESVTLNGVRSIRIIEGRGADGKSRSSNSDSPKTLWFAAGEKEQSTNMLPFGWVVVEILPLSATVPEWPALESICERHTSVARTLGSKLAAQRERMAQIRAQSESRRRAEEERERIRIEQEKIRQVEALERQRRMDAMSEEERKIEALRELSARELKAGALSPNSQTASERINLLRAALEWDSMDAREQAAQAIEETVKRLPWSKKSKDQRKEELARLRKPK